MSFLFGGSKGKPVAQTQPQYTSLQLQTSALGVGVTILYGKNRIPANLIWYGDFQTIPHVTQTTVSGGKGGSGSSTSTSTSYTYATAVQMGLCEGPIQDIGTIWADRSTTTLAGLGLTLFTGTAGQTPWSYLLANHNDQALSYRFTALVATSFYDLGSSANLPTHNFEVVGLLSGTMPGTPDVNLGDVIPDLLKSAQYGLGLSSAQIGSVTQYKTYCRAQGLFFSPVINESEQVASIIDRWALLSNSWIFWDGAQVRFVPLSDSAITAHGVTYTPINSPIYDLTFEDFVTDGASPPVEVTRTDPADAYNAVKVEINDRVNRAYQANPIEWRDDGLGAQYGLVTAPSIRAKEITDPNVGAIAAALIGQRYAYLRNTYAFRLGWEFVLLEVGDIVTLTEPHIGLDRFPVRIKSIAEDEKGHLAFTAEEFPKGIGLPATLSPQVPSSTPLNMLVDPGPVNPPAIFEPAPAFTAGIPEVWMAASGGGDWGGADVFISFDSTTYSKIGTILNPARQGVLTAPLASHSDPDTTDTLSVDLTISQGNLPSDATHADADADRTLCLITNNFVGSAPPPGAPGSGLGFMLGLKMGGGNTANTTMAGWLGRELDICGLTITTTGFIGSGRDMVPANTVLDISFPMLSIFGETPALHDMAQAAGGGYDSYYIAMAQAMASFGNPVATFCPGWEMSGQWYAWSMPGPYQGAVNQSYANYIAAYRRISIIVKQYNPHALSQFCYAIGRDPTPYWPGAYHPITNPGGVDVISCDFYQSNVEGDMSGDRTWAASQTTGYYWQPSGFGNIGTLDWMVNFAISEGVKVGLREYGAGPGPGTDGSGGGSNDGTWVAASLAWIASLPAGLFLFNMWSDDAPADDIVNGQPAEQAAWIAAYNGTFFDGTWWLGPATPTQGAPPTLPVINPVAFYVSLTGNDANPGTPSSPFATLGKARTEMAGSSTKLTYVRAGTYTQTSDLDLTSADDGTTYSYYPPDGYNSAIIDGVAGTYNGITINGGSNIIIDGLQFQNVKVWGVGIHGGNSASGTIPDVTPEFASNVGTASGNIVRNCIIHNVLNVVQAADTFLAAGIIACGDVPNTTISNNVIHDTSCMGIMLLCLAPAGVGAAFGDISNGLIENNVVYRQGLNVDDTGAIYCQNYGNGGTMTNVIVRNNFIRDYGGGRGLYADNGASNITYSGNIVGPPLTPTNGGSYDPANHAGGFQSQVFNDGGANLTWTHNIFDLGATGNTVLMSEQSQIPGPATLGDDFSNNVVIAGFAGTQATNQYAASGTSSYYGAAATGIAFTPATKTHNMYHSYAGGTIDPSGDAADSGAGDTSPVQSDPLISGWTYNLDTASPAFSAPVSFTAIVGNWGPPGYVIPQTGTAPSCPLTGPSSGPTASPGTNPIIPSNGELLSYGTSTLTATYNFDLTYLRRGQVGTSVDAHPTGSYFTRVNTSGTDGTTLSYHLPNAYVGATLHFKFVSFNRFGLAREDISTVVAYTYTPSGSGFGGGGGGVPNVPTGLAATGGTNQISLSWNANVSTDGVRHYKIYGAEGHNVAFGSTVVVGSVSGTTFVYGGLPAATEFTFYLIAENISGDSASEGPVTATTNAQPGAVSIRVLTAGASTTLSATTDYLLIIKKSVGSATTVNLPASPAASLQFVIKDEKGDAATNHITITPAAGLIDGASTYVISTNYGSAIVVYDGAEWIVASSR